MSSTADETSNREVAAELATPPAEPAPRMQFLHSYTYVFETSDTLTNLTLVSVCMLIPVIGPIVLAGYQYEIVAALHRDPQRRCPAFDFSRFGDYLGRGVWKFLADMVAQCFLVPLYLFVVYGGLAIIFGIGMAFSGNQGNQAGPAIGIAALIVVPLAMLILLVATLLLRLILNPLVLKASLSGEAADVLDFKFLGDFLRRTWRESCWELLWIYVTYPIVILAGLLCCLIGVLPAIAWAMLADAHTNWQLYEIYLARGGQPLPLKEDKAAG